MKTDVLAGMIACCKFTYEEAITLIENHNRQFDAIMSKQAEIIARLKEVLVLDEYDFNALQKYKDKVGKLESELQSLQAGEEPEEEPKHPTSWRDFTMTDDVESSSQETIGIKAIRKQFDKEMGSQPTKMLDYRWQGVIWYRNYLSQLVEPQEERIPDVGKTINEPKQTVENTEVKYSIPYIPTNVDFTTGEIIRICDEFVSFDNNCIAVKQKVEEYAQSPNISVTDKMIINYALNYVAHKDLKPANKGLIKDALIIGAKALRDGKMLV